MKLKKLKEGQDFQLPAFLLKEMKKKKDKANGKGGDKGGEKKNKIAKGEEDTQKIKKSNENPPKKQKKKQEIGEFFGKENNPNVSKSNDTEQINNETVDLLNMSLL